MRECASTQEMRIGSQALRLAGSAEELDADLEGCGLPRGARRKVAAALGLALSPESRRRASTVGADSFVIGANSGADLGAGGASEGGGGGTLATPRLSAARCGSRPSSDCGSDPLHHGSVMAVSEPSKGGSTLMGSVSEPSKRGGTLTQNMGPPPRRDSCLPPSSPGVSTPTPAGLHQPGRRQSQLRRSSSTLSSSAAAVAR